MTWLIIFYTAASILLIGLSIPMIRGKVKPNAFYGFRIPLTTNNPEIWYPANRYAGKWLCALGVILLLASLALPFLFLEITVDSYAIAIAVLALGGLGLTFAFGWRYARHLAAESASGT
ncbi:MAG: SdpI family protein [Caldilineales bacterium]|nr:SdpI family protein [Caldilineales bacterium]